MKAYTCIGEMEEEVTYQPKKGKPFYNVCLKTLRFTYFLPVGNDTECIFLVKFISVLLLFSCTWCHAFIHLVMTITNETGVQVSEDIAILVNFGGIITTSVLFTVHYKKWLDFCGIICDFTDFGKPSNFEEAKRRGDVHTIAFYVYIVIGVLIYFMTAILEIPACEQSNEKLGLQEVCGTLGPIWLPNGAPSLPVLVLINIIQLLSVWGSLFSGIAVCFIFYCSTLLVLTHVDNFRKNFQSIFEETDMIQRSNKLRQCINYHKKILGMGTYLSHLTKLNQGHAFITAAVCIGCLGNQILTEKSIRSFMLLMGYITGAFVLCHSGQIMMDKTESVQDIVYFSKWYTCEPKMIRDMQFIILRCKYPIYLNILPFGYMHYPLLLMIVKTSYSYLTLLNQTT